MTTTYVILDPETDEIHCVCSTKEKAEVACKKLDDIGKTTNMIEFKLDKFDESIVLAVCSICFNRKTGEVWAQDIGKSALVTRDQVGEFIVEETGSYLTVTSTLGYQAVTDKIKEMGYELLPYLGD